MTSLSTKFSEFIRNASEEEKERVYRRVMEISDYEQELVIISHRNSPDCLVTSPSYVLPASSIFDLLYRCAMYAVLPPKRLIRAMRRPDL